MATNANLTNAADKAKLELAAREVARKKAEYEAAQHKRNSLIRALVAKGAMSQNEIARVLGVTPMAVAKMRAR
jgi:DNA-binding transcriptional regulator YiaG